MVYNKYYNCLAFEFEMREITNQSGIKQWSMFSLKANKKKTHIILFACNSLELKSLLVLATEKLQEASLQDFFYFYPLFLITYYSQWVSSSHFILIICTNRKGGKKRSDWPHAWQQWWSITDHWNFSHHCQTYKLRFVIKD